MKLSVAIITFNEEANLPRTLASVRSLVANGAGEVVIVDSGSTDRTAEIARQFGAKVFVEDWKGFAAQKNSALEKCSGDWILSLDADEEVSQQLGDEIQSHLDLDLSVGGYILPRRNYFLGRWIRHGGFYPDPKLRLVRRGLGRFEDRAVHESLEQQGRKKVAVTLHSDLIHHSYPTLYEYIEHMNRYSSLGAEMALREGKTQGNFLAWKWNVVIRPAATFFYNYLFRLGFLDGREGLLLHIYHAVYVSWKYAKAWELSRAAPQK